jgi:hypothetical protein
MSVTGSMLLTLLLGAVVATAAARQTDRDGSLRALADYRLLGRSTAAAFALVQFVAAVCGAMLIAAPRLGAMATSSLVIVGLVLGARSDGCACVGANLTRGSANALAGWTLTLALAVAITRPPRISWTNAAAVCAGSAVIGVALAATRRARRKRKPFDLTSFEPMPAVGSERAAGAAAVVVRDGELVLSAAVTQAALSSGVSFDGERSVFLLGRACRCRNTADVLAREVSPGAIILLTSATKWLSRSYPDSIILDPANDFTSHDAMVFSCVEHNGALRVTSQHRLALSEEVVQA